ncbi:unnamed protein product [Pleuronectes platessa]|uniref:Uncharacterized protein n=1 Tax=Pleuronectes platessa TaxID=8262 RepID=A0A9N7V6M5_PLEPL|nr:unnamed protein product [Pleuronectes platessa]
MGRRAPRQPEAQAARTTDTDTCYTACNYRLYGMLLMDADGSRDGLLLIGRLSLCGLNAASSPSVGLYKLKLLFPKQKTGQGSRMDGRLGDSSEQTCVIYVGRFGNALVLEWVVRRGREGGLHIL